MTVAVISRRPLARRAARRVVGSAIVVGLALFLPAGTLSYWQAWVYLAILVVSMVASTAYLVVRDPELLERRLRTNEPQSLQRIIVGISLLCYGLLLVLPSFDRRLGWSRVPPFAVIAADAVIVLGYMLFGRVLVENRYASRTVGVDAGQKVIDTGPYSVVRHPMYLSATLVALATPLALGSWWAYIPAVFIPLLLAARIEDEEKLLRRYLQGYERYTKRVRYRLIPGVW